MARTKRPAFTPSTKMDSCNETKLRVTCGDDRTTERDTHLLHMSPPPNHISIFLLIRIRHVVPRDNYYENHSNILMYEIRAPLFMW